MSKPFPKVTCVYCCITTSSSVHIFLHMVPDAHRVPCLDSVLKLFFFSHTFREMSTHQCCNILHKAEGIFKNLSRRSSWCFITSLGFWTLESDPSYPSSQNAHIYLQILTKSLVCPRYIKYIPLVLRGCLDT